MNYSVKIIDPVLLTYTFSICVLYGPTKPSWFRNSNHSLRNQSSRYISKAYVKYLNKLLYACAINPGCCFTVMVYCIIFKWISLWFQQDSNLLKEWTSKEYHEEEEDVIFRNIWHFIPPLIFIHSSNICRLPPLCQALGSVSTSIETKIDTNISNRAWSEADKKHTNKQVNIQ